jgi:hypothetical protein
MKALLLSIALLAGQLQSSQNEEVVRLPPHSLGIPVSDGGKLVELLYASSFLHLPSPPPKPDSQGNAWHVDIRNLGPNDVTIVAADRFSVHLSPRETTHIRSDGSLYLVRR